MAKTMMKTPQMQEGIMKMANINMNGLVQSIEFYKLQHGRYPESLSDLQESFKEQTALFIYDPTDPITFQVTGRKENQKPRTFFYERVADGSGYYLLSVGIDGIPFTADDLLPEVGSTESKNLGLRIHPGSRNP